MSATVCIPARLASSRLERKLLADVCGKTMLERTHEVAVRAGCGPVLVLVDCEELAEVVNGFGGDAVLTDPGAESGTARIASVADRIDTDVVVNLQGDAPLTDPAVVGEAATAAASSSAPVTMPVYAMTEPDDVHDPSVVKVVLRADGRTLYCSRSAVPHVRDHVASEWPAAVRFWGHVGLYAYKREFLAAYPRIEAGSLEGAERLEQLRILEAGFEIDTFVVPPQGPSVDTQAQLERVRQLFADR